MHSFSICALAALFGAVAAAPVEKRAVVWVTETDVDVVTIPVTETVWIDGPGTTAEAIRSHTHTWPAEDTTTTASATTPSAYSAPATSASSVYVAPTTSSSSVYVAPTTSSVYVAPTTSSVYVAPTTISSVYVAPTTSSTSVYVAPTTYAAPTTTTSSAAAASSTASSTDGTYSGSLTYYTPGLGSCGITSTSSDAIAALDHVMMTADWTGNPNDNPLCGKAISITYGGVTKSATIVDTCEGCPSSESLDLSPTLFSEFADESVGVVDGMTWTFA